MPFLHPSLHLVKLVPIIQEYRQQCENDFQTPLTRLLYVLGAYYFFENIKQPCCHSLHPHTFSCHAIIIGEDCLSHAFHAFRVLSCAFPALSLALSRALSRPLSRALSHAFRALAHAFHALSHAFHAFHPSFGIIATPSSVRTRIRRRRVSISSLGLFSLIYLILFSTGSVSLSKRTSWWQWRT